jgi:hypothetical protein
VSAQADAPDPLPKQQVIALDYEALFTNLSDDTLARQERRKRMLSPLVDKLAQVEPDSEESSAILDELFRWPDLEEWVAPTMLLERLQSMFIAMHQAAGSFLLFVDHFHCLLGGEWDRYPIDAATLLKPALAQRQIQLIGTCTWPSTDSTLNGMRLCNGGFKRFSCLIPWQERQQLLSSYCL